MKSEESEKTSDVLYKGGIVCAEHISTKLSQMPTKKLVEHKKRRKGGYFRKSSKVQ